jgi:hypothetical protein
VTHEIFDRQDDVKQSSDRNFGLVMAGVFLVVALLPLVWRFSLGAVHWWAVGVSVMFATLALTWTAPLAPLNKLWLQFGLLLHKIVSPIVLGLLFYVAVMPTGLIMRLLGKDPLRLRRDPNAKSYWIIRTPPGPPPDTMKNQF